MRANRSTHLDLLWREFFSIGRTGTANKTQYVPMSIMRFLLADALIPPLRDLYHALRAIPMSSRVYVGWDSPIEWLSGAITSGVTSLVSEQRIENFVENYSFLDHNYAALVDVIEVARPVFFHMRNMDGNVDRMKHFLVDKVGVDWVTATAANQVSKLGIDTRGSVPWDEVRTTMTRQGSDSTPAFVARHVRDLTSSFFAFTP